MDNAPLSSSTAANWPEPLPEPLLPLRLRSLRASRATLAGQLLAATRTASGLLGRWTSRVSVQFDGETTSIGALLTRLRVGGCTDRQLRTVRALLGADVAGVLARAVRLPGIGGDLGAAVRPRPQFEIARLGAQVMMRCECQVPESPVGPQQAWRASGRIELSLRVDVDGSVCVLEAGDQLRVWGGPGLTA